MSNVQSWLDTAVSTASGDYGEKPDYTAAAFQALMACAEALNTLAQQSQSPPVSAGACSSIGPFKPQDLRHDLGMQFVCEFLEGHNGACSAVGNKSVRWKRGEHG